ncbi:MAG: pyridoxal 5'-phosphate synthase glutaminase subunit PdxT [Thermoplasmatota archaeon]
MLRVAVVAVQGAFVEHRDAIRRASEAARIPADATLVRTGAELESCDAAILPGGESTTIAKLLLASGLHDTLTRRAGTEDFPIMGTCAGLILLSKEGDEQVASTRTKLLGLMDMAVNRNAFGRQRESFEASVDLAGLGTVPAVFIRSPAITRTWGACRHLGEIQASFEGPDARPDPRSGWQPPNLGRVVVAAEQGNRLAFAFHPELTMDSTCHAYFLERAQAWKKR